MKFGVTLGYTRSKFKGTDKSLMQIPSLKGNIKLSYITDRSVLVVNSELAAKQNNVDEFEEPTTGYAVFNSYFQFTISAGKLLHNFALSVGNIFDKEYRNHLSRVKSILPEAGRNFRLTYKLYFHI